LCSPGSVTFGLVGKLGLVELVLLVTFAVAFERLTALAAMLPLIGKSAPVEVALGLGLGVGVLFLAGLGAGAGLGTGVDPLLSLLLESKLFVASGETL
jgi:hypothetical protein